MFPGFIHQAETIFLLGRQPVAEFWRGTGPEPATMPGEHAYGMLALLLRRFLLFPDSQPVSGARENSLNTGFHRKNRP